jgi:excisionase family DNA binding protein
MNIADLLKDGANVNLTIRANDLKEFARSIVEETRAIFDRELDAKKPEVYYTIQEACEILGVGKKTLWRWNKRGYLVSVKIGGLVRYRKSDLDRILNFRK